ncbi:hypothetical protein J4402_05050 [Candidatus Pacearchaeota archaeon]|nr:hypothetical protein [Candidatus Pacearchaeota archaeon]
MKSWLKGGLIGGIVSILFMALPIVFMNVSWWPYLMTFVSYLSFPISFLLANLGDIEGMGGGILFAFLLIPLGILINFFLLGAIIGFIVGKIKSRKNN